MAKGLIRQKGANTGTWLIPNKPAQTHNTGWWVVTKWKQFVASNTEVNWLVAWLKRRSALTWRGGGGFVLGKNQLAKWENFVKGWWCNQMKVICSISIKKRGLEVQSIKVCYGKKICVCEWSGYAYILALNADWFWGGVLMSWAKGDGAPTGEGKRIESNLLRNLVQMILVHQKSEFVCYLRISRKGLCTSNKIVTYFTWVFVKGTW